MSIASKLEYLDNTKNYIRQCIQQKGVTVPSNTTFRQYGDKILEIDTEKHPPGWEGEGGSGSGKLTVGTALPTGKDFVLSPSEGYDGFSSVNVKGDVNLKPENIAQGITIYGVTGTKTVPSEVTTNIPASYQNMFDQARQLWTGEYEHLMILESNEAVAFGFMLTGFGVESYDETNSEFTAHRWVYVAYNKISQTWKVENWESGTSNGNSYIWNIRYCDTQIYYGSRMIYPFSGNSGNLPNMSYTDSFTVTMKIGACMTWLYYSNSGYQVREDLAKHAVGFWVRLADSKYLCTYVRVNDPSQVKTQSSLPTYSYKNHVCLLSEYDSADDGELVKVTFQGKINMMINLLRLVSIDTPLPSTLNAISQYEVNTSPTSMPGITSDRVGMFYKSDIETLSSDVFSKLDPYISNANGLFARSKIKNLPSGLFSRFKHLRQAVSMFEYATNLENIPEDLFEGLTELYSVYAFCYRATGIRNVPQNLFSTNISLENCSYAFSYSQINVVPSGFLQNNKKLTNCSYMFSNCENLRRIEGSFLPNSENSLNLSYMFYNCVSLSSIPDSIFSEVGEYSSISGMFSGCTGITGDLPELWNDSRFTDVPHSSCFRGCTNAKNYKDVPTGWN